jgi:hypothetical protein
MSMRAMCKRCGVEPVVYRSARRFVAWCRCFHAQALTEKRAIEAWDAGITRRRVAQPESKETK